MKIVNLKHAGEVSVEKTAYPAPEKDFAIVKIKYCGICGSDTGAFSGKNPTVIYPLIGLGHEGVGVLEEIAENDKGLKKGDLVALEPYISCGQCHQCQKGETGNCTKLRVCGVHTVGMMSDYFKHPVRLLHKLPEGLSLEKAVLVEPFTIGMQGATQGKTKPGDICLIFGAGVIGLMAAFSVKHLGGTPIVVDVVQERLDAARDMGIEHVFHTPSGDLLQYVAQLTQGKMADVLIECTGAPQVIKDMHLYCAYGANIALVGWPKTPVEVHTIKCMQKELTLNTSRNSSGKFPLCMKLIENGFLPTEKFLSVFVKVDEVGQTLEKIIAAPQDYLKVVVDFQ